MVTSNPHDSFIKRIFSSREDSIAFLGSTLPADVLEVLNLQNLEQTKETFVKKNQNPTQTDMLWKIPTKSGEAVYAYLLFEHKSYYDPNTFVQVLGYLAQIYSWQKENQKALVLVIPFVFYHGEKKWDLGLRYSESFGNSKDLVKLSRYIPDFEIELFELGKKDVSAQFDRLSLRIFLTIIQKIKADLDELLPIFKRLLKDLSRVETEAKKVEILEKLLYYIFSAREKNEQEFRNAEFYKIEGLTGAFMTILEELREEGIARGILQGELKGKVETAERMFAEGLPLSLILKVTGLTEVDLRNRGLIS